MNEVLAGGAILGIGGFTIAHLIHGIVEMMTYKKYANRTAYIKQEFVDEDRNFVIRMGTVVDYKDGKFTLMVNDYGLFYTMQFEKNQVEFN
jgi:hypothetical protein